jgi:hypothetical protein
MERDDYLDSNSMVKKDYNTRVYCRWHPEQGGMLKAL